MPDSDPPCPMGLTPDPPDLRPARERAADAARLLACEHAEWPWFVRVEVRGDARPWLVLVVNTPVPNPGLPLASVAGLTVYRESSADA